MNDMIDIFIGYDSKEIVAYHVLCQSIISNSSRPVRFMPINLSNIGHIFRRQRDILQSTEFSFSRFLVPYLSKYSRWSIFMDCDMLVRADIAELFALKDERYAVMVCKHDYTPSTSIKFRGNVQTKYEKKNWSSLILFNNSKCASLSRDYVNTASGLELHQFKWLSSEEEIGALPLEWNWLVGEYPYNEGAKIIHFTLGGPYFNDYSTTDYADEWNAVFLQAKSAAK
jgi:lipopolysaccharide biosynthesis glycosyltransferase